MKNQALFSSKDKSKKLFAAIFVWRFRVTAGNQQTTKFMLAKFEKKKCFAQVISHREFSDSHIYSVIRWSFSIQNNPKNLDPS